MATIGKTLEIGLLSIQNASLRIGNHLVPQKPGGCMGVLQLRATLLRKIISSKINVVKLKLVKSMFLSKHSS